MFRKGSIIAYPTDTSFGLGVRADDSQTLERLYILKKRPIQKYISLMVRDWEMLEKFAFIPKTLSKDLFFNTPYTALLKPKPILPSSPFWDSEKVGFRICTIEEVARYITYPITATSANISGETSLFSEKDIHTFFGDKIEVLSTHLHTLTPLPPSQIWDHTVDPLHRIR